MFYPLRSLLEHTDSAVIAVFFLAAFNPVNAEIVLPDIYADDMVFQRNSPIFVEGTADASTTVTVSIIKQDTGGSESILRMGSVLSDSNGQWYISLTQMSATSGQDTHILSVSDGVTERRISPVHVGDVWICSGQSNMNFLMRPYTPWSDGVLNWENEVAAAGDPLLNVFTVVPEVDWKEADSVHGSWRPDNPTLAEYFSAVPYLFGREIRQEIGVPVGIIVASLGGTSIRHWLHKEAQEDIAASQESIALHAERRITYASEIEQYYQTTLPAYREQSISNHWEPTYAAPYSEPYPGWRYQPGGLYHAMLAPLENFPIKGVVWYQGESDSSKYATYEEFLTVLIESWRGRRADPEMPFLIVQLANYDPVATGSDPATYTDVWAALREVQAIVAEATANSGLVVTADVGNPTNIHPRDKQTVAYRAGLLARFVAYEESEILASGPSLKSFSIENDVFVLRFNNVGSGLLIDPNLSTGTGPSFEIAGSDGVFYPADVRIVGDNLEVSSVVVTEPVYLHYAYHNDPKLILYNKEGLPAAPFRVSIPKVTLAEFSFDASNLANSQVHSSVESATITTGQGNTEVGYNTGRGTPPPSFFIRTTDTPQSLEAAVSEDVYIEVNLQAKPGYSFDFSVGGFYFDIARSTTTGTFSYAVRSSQDGFNSNITEATILTLNETFGNVFIPFPEAVSVDDLQLRIYIWDDLDSSSRAFRFDSVQFVGIPQLRLTGSLEEGSWNQTDLSYVYGNTPDWGYSRFLGHIFVRLPWFYQIDFGWIAYHSAVGDGSHHWLWSQQYGWIYVNQGDGGRFYWNNGSRWNLDHFLNPTG